MAVPLITAGIGLLKSAVGGWFEHKQAKTEKKRQVELATIDANASADTAASSGMASSWKDEYLTVLFSVPLIVVFHASVWGDPEDIERVKQAFAAMQELPEWYMWSIVGIVIGTFGLRGLAKMLPGK